MADTVEQMRPHGKEGKRGASGSRWGENSSLSWSLTVEIKEKYQRAKGGKQQRIQCPLKGQEMLMSFAEKRIFTIDLQLHCHAGCQRKSEIIWEM